MGEIDGEMHDLSVVLKPGMVLNEFLRPDKFSDKILQDEECGPARDILPAFTLVWMQLGVGNIEQAAKGRLLKVKRMKTINPRSLTSCLYNAYNMPGTEQEFRLVNNGSTYKSIRECFDSRSNCILLHRGVSPTAYIVQDTDGPDYVMVDMDSQFEMAHVDAQALQNVLPSASVQEKIKFLNICIVAGSVTAVVRSRPVDAVVLNGDGEKYRARVVALTVNYNSFLGFETISSMMSSENMHESMQSSECQMRMGSNYVLWSKNNVWPGTSKTIFYKLELTDRPGDGSETFSFCDKGHAAGHKLLKITMQEQDFNSVFEAYEKASKGEESEPASVITLELRFANKNASSVLGKRPRPALEWE